MGFFYGMLWAMQGFFLLSFLVSRRVRSLLLGDVFARIEDMMRLSDSDSFAFEEAEHDVERFRKLLHERTFSLVVLSAFFSQTGMMLGSIPLWRGGTWPFGVQLLTLAFLASLMLLFLLWRFRVMSSTIGGQLLVFLFVLFVASLAMVSGEGSKQYVLQYTSVPFLVTVVMVVTKSAYWALFQNLLWVLLVVAFKFEWLPVVSKPWYCVECLKQATEYINLCVGCAMIVCFLAISVDEVQTARFVEGLFRRKERQKDAMLSVVSHEFKTPLNGLLVSAQLLSRLPEVRCLSKDAREMIGSVSQCGTLLSLLVQNVLLRERLPKLELSLIPLAPLLADVSQILSNLGTVRTLVEYRDAVVFGNHSALLQILLNLGSNAIKFSQLPIVVRVTRDGDMVGIAVEDDGPGIPDHFRDQLFKPYARVNSSNM